MNERTKRPGWTPRRLLSLLMALIMTLSLLPTAALADELALESDLEFSKLSADENRSIFYQKGDGSSYADVYFNCKSFSPKAALAKISRSRLALKAMRGKISHVSIRLK